MRGIYKMIISFRDKYTETVFSGTFSKKLPLNIQRAAFYKLRVIHLAASLNELRIPPSNHLEKLSGNYKGYYSIRINNQYRICFEVRDVNKFINVCIVDYHN